MASAVGNIVKNTVVYGYALTQPFAYYIDAYPMIQDKLLLEAQAIQFGQSGELVQYLQSKLNNLGYYDDELDGEYGILTEHAIKKMQSAHELDANGIANDETLQTLIKTEKKEQLEIIETLLEGVQYGTKSESVKEVQEILFLYGYHQADIDSVYGPITEKSYERLKVEIEGPASIAIVDETPAKQQVKDTSHQAEAEVDIKESNPKQVETPSFNQSNLINNAKSMIGIQYVWGGTSTSGFDCSGYIQYVYNEENITIPRTVSDIWNFAVPVDSPSIGDLVFFETYQAGPSHLGIYLGDQQFIHAGVSNGVQISNLQDDYWKQRYIGTKRIP